MPYTSFDSDSAYFIRDRKRILKSYKEEYALLIAKKRHGDADKISKRIAHEKKHIKGLKKEHLKRFGSDAW